MKKLEVICMCHEPGSLKHAQNVLNQIAFMEMYKMAVTYKVQFITPEPKEVSYETLKDLFDHE